MKNIKVLYVCNWFNSIYNDIFNNLDDDIEMTMILSKKFPDYKKSDMYDTKVFSTIDLANLLYFWQRNRENFLILHKKDLETEIILKKPDIIISNLIYSPSTFQAYRLAKKYGIKFILQTEIKVMPKLFIEKKLFYFYNLFFGKRLVKGADKIISWNSDSSKFVQKLYGIDSKSISVILPSVDINYFHPIKKKKSKKLKILMVARFLDYKNHKDLLIAARKMIDSGFKNFEISFLGTGPLEENIKEMCDNLKLGSYVKFKGYIPYSEVPNFMAKQDLLILPSYNEAIGICVIEALACGIPCIVSDTCGAKDYIIEGKNGFIFKTGDVSDLNNKILKFSDKSLLETMYKSERKLALNFSQEKIGKQFSDEIRTVSMSHKQNIK